MKSSSNKRNHLGKTQRSKLLASWSLAIWAVIGFICLASHIFCEMSEISTSGVESILTNATTLAGIVITGYMGNSSVEKYTAGKVKIESLIKESKENEGGMG